MAFELGRRGFLSSPLAALQAPGARERKIQAVGDGLLLEPEEYGLLLAELGRNGKAKPDYFSRGGVVEELERTVAERFGKETAVWLPTGTMANHLAVRMLAGTRRRVLVQASSHLFNDCGDCAQTLSGLHLVPLAPGRATFTLDDARRAAEESEGGRVATPIGAIQIESPVRRKDGERFDFGTMTAVSAWARSRGIGMHLDGARIFLESAYTRRSLREYAALFDTVYVSMYKYFNAPSGAVLAGPKALLENLFHSRRMFGGGLHEVWPFAAVALETMRGFEERFARAVGVSEAVIEALLKTAHFEIERVPQGTNIFYLRTLSVNAPVYQQRLLQAGVIATAEGARLRLQVNESWLRAPAEEIAARFVMALGAG